MMVSAHHLSNIGITHSTPFQLSLNAQLNALNSNTPVHLPPTPELIVQVSIKPKTELYFCGSHSILVLQIQKRSWRISPELLLI